MLDLVTGSELAYAVRLTDVSKSYVAYAKPHYWLADFLGAGRLLREGKHYRSHWALRDITLKIPKGGKFAFVGRNGAGKSTLLRIISENITATTGKVEVRGHCEALMQLGAGFNPEFTGRENVLTALAYMGITGQGAKEKLWDILDFSELDDFIEQPVRTYSSGMYLRLAFSVATVIAPEILIIDEILAAGDMYFQSKCLGRIQELTSGPGTTVLFVSHDLQSAQRICDTFVWLDRGRIVKMGPSGEVRAAYEDAIRKQEEVRLRARNLRLRRQTISALQAAGEDGVHLLGQLVRDESGGPSGPYVDAIRLFVNGSLSEEIRVGDAMDDSTHYPSFVISDPAESRWGIPERRGGRLARAVEPAGAGINGAKFALFLAHHEFGDPGLKLEVAVSYQDNTTTPSHVELNAGVAGLRRLLSLEHAGDQQWRTIRATLPEWIYANPGTAASAAVEAKPANAETPPEKRFGTGQLVMERVRFLTDEGEERFVFETGRRMSVVVNYRTKDADILGTPMLWAVGFERIDGITACTLISTVQDRVFAVRPSGELTLVLDPLLLTKGQYRVSVVIFSELDLDGSSPHFTRSSLVYDMHRLAYEVRVEGTYHMEIGFFRAPVRWLSDEAESLAAAGRPIPQQKEFAG
jgi:lipopolysaccharide transport system ATP-binding protein